MTGNIYIFGEIGVDTALLDVIAQVKKFPDATDFNVYINSPGGFVDAGFDILNYLKSLGKPLAAIGRGMVASIATVIFMAAEKRTIEPNTQFMIHLPWTEGVGNASDLERYAKELRAVEKQLIDFYTKELSLTPEAIEPLLREETWLTEDQLKQLGFVNSDSVAVLAKAYYKPKNNKMTKEQKNALSIFDKLAKLLSGADAKNLVLQDSTGKEIDFPDVAEGNQVSVGDTATVDGQPASGDFTMPDGKIFKFTDGKLEEIAEPSGEGNDLEAANQQIADLQQEIADMKASHQKEIDDMKAANKSTLDEISEEFKKVKAQVTSTFKAEFQKNSKKEEDEDESVKSDYKDILARAKDKSKNKNVK